MPLSILVPMILVGLPVVIGLVWWVNKENSHEVMTVVGAKERFGIDFPNLDIEAVVISDDGRSALLKLFDGEGFGLVHRVGQNYLTRLLDENVLHGFETNEKGVAFNLKDFTLKRVVFEDGTGKAHKMFNSNSDRKLI